MFDLPLKITASAALRLGQIERVLGGWDALVGPAPLPKQQWSNRVQAVFSTVAIAGSALSLEGATHVLEGQRGLLPARDVLELENTQLAYEHLGEWDPLNERHLLDAHRVLMDVLIVDAGRVRKGQLRPLRSLLRFLRDEPEVPAVVSAIVFHYALLLLRPFSDGNGRMGRLWQQALLRRASPLFAHVPTEAVIREHEAQHFAAWAAARRLGSFDLFLEHMLGMLQIAMERLEAQLRSRAETVDDRLVKARRALANAWFTRKGYLTLFPELSTASASRDLARALAARALTSRGSHRSTEYRFRSSAAANRHR